MKKIFALFLVFFTGITCAENTIIALVNNVPISLNSLNDEFISLSFIDNGTKVTERFYGAYPITNSVHVFGGLDKTTSTGVTNSETSGIAYESCCWSLRAAHFKDSTSSDKYNYGTRMELIFNGLGSTSSSLGKKIERKIPGYSANLR